MEKIITDIVTKNIVLVGEFELQKLDKLFYFQSNLFDLEELNRNNKYDVFTFPRIVGKDVQLDLAENQIVISQRAGSQLDLSNYSLKFINNLPEYKLIAFGFNHILIKWFDDINISEHSKRIFTNSESPIAKKFNDIETNFGAIIHRKFRNAELKIDFIPESGVETTTNKKIDGYRIKFNYHFESLKMDMKELLKNEIVDFNQYYEYSEEIVNSLI